MSRLIKLNVVMNLKSCEFCKYFVYTDALYGDHTPDGIPIIHSSPYYCIHKDHNVEIYPIYGYGIDEVTCDKHEPKE